MGHQHRRMVEEVLGKQCACFFVFSFFHSKLSGQRDAGLPGICLILECQVHSCVVLERALVEKSEKQQRQEHALKSRRWCSMAMCFTTWDIRMRYSTDVADWGLLQLLWQPLLGRSAAWIPFPKATHSRSYTALTWAPFFLFSFFVAQFSI